MGMFDYVHVHDPRFVCSEGHRIVEFQTYDLGCTLGDTFIDKGGVVEVHYHLTDGSEPGLPLNETIEIHGHCEKCPAFVQNGTLNLCAFGVEFRVVVVGDKAMEVTRTSESLAEFLAREPNEPWMSRCHGPMPYKDAHHLHVHGVRHPREQRP